MKAFTPLKNYFLKTYKSLFHGKPTELQPRTLGILAGDSNYYESSDCWENDDELNHEMLNGPLFPEE